MSGDWLDQACAPGRSRVRLYDCTRPDREWSDKCFPLVWKQRSSASQRLSVCPEMIFRLRKPLGNKATNSDCPTGRKTSLFSNFFENLDNNNLWLWQGFAMESS